jgi:hypothetical protein
MKTSLKTGLEVAAHTHTVVAGAANLFAETSPLLKAKSFMLNEHANIGFSSYFILIILYY